MEQCACLPLAIVTVAGALKNKKLLSYWNDALRRLQRSTLDESVYTSIRLSYDFLKIEENAEGVLDDEDDPSKGEPAFAADEVAPNMDVPEADAPNKADDDDDVDVYTYSDSLVLLNQGGI